MNDPHQPYVSCPYNRQHQVPRHRLQAHIVKCQKNYPELQVCPFNATHRLTAEELKIHVATCPDKIEMYEKDDNPKQMGDIYVPKPLFNRDYLPETDPNHEMWDDWLDFLEQTIDLILVIKARQCFTDIGAKEI